MRDILAGGLLVKRDAVELVSMYPAYARRRGATRVRGVTRLSTPQIIRPCIQPGQLASPLLKFGFPSLALH